MARKMFTAENINLNDYLSENQTQEVVKTQAPEVKQTEVKKQTVKKQEKKAEAPAQPQMNNLVLNIEMPEPKKERKDKRINLIIQTSLFDKATKKLKHDGFVSFNELVGKLLEAYINSK